MRVDPSEWERLASEMRGRAGLRVHDNERSTVIVVRHLGAAGLRIDRELEGGAYLTQRVDGGYQIVIRPDLPDVRFATIHELSHYGIRVIAGMKLPADAEERGANYTAAAILAPKEAVLRVYRHFGAELRRLRAIANIFGLSQTAMQLRLAEVLGDERAVVTARNGNVLSRGLRWRTEPTLALARGRRRSPGVAKVTLHGGIDEGRVALHAK